MGEAVTVPSWTMMTSIVSVKSLARDRHTDRQIDRHTHTHVLSETFSKS